MRNYYAEEERIIALDKAKKELNSRKSKEIWGYNDCWQFVVEYDKALNGDKSRLQDLDLNYDNPISWEVQIKKLFRNYEVFASYTNYEIVKNKKPKTGDVAYQIMNDGNISALIADKSHWVTATGDNGVIRAAQKMFLERNLPLIVRPIRD